MTDDPNKKTEPDWIDVGSVTLSAQAARWKITSVRSGWDVTFRVRVDERNPKR